MNFLKLKIFLHAVLIFLATAGCCHAQLASPPFDHNAVGLTISELFEHLDTSPAVLNDSTEGGPASSLSAMKGIWQGRLYKNTDPNVNMFGQYYLGLHDQVAARYAAGPCKNGDHFNGAWENIGPDDIGSENVGYVECVWADPDDPKHILAGTYGGIFETKNGGAQWINITDNAPVSYGQFTISSIAVSPIDKNIIYATTGVWITYIEAYSLTGEGGYLSGSLLKSTDGGHSWNQEVVGTSQTPGDLLNRANEVVFTPDGNNIIVTKMDRIFIRPTNGNVSSWAEITNTTNTSSIPDFNYPNAEHWWLNIAFVPGDPNANNFFYATTANWVGANVGAILKFEKSGNIWTSTPVFIGGASNNSMGLNPCLAVEISIPDNKYLFAVFKDIVGGAHAPIAKYDLTTQQWTLINANPDWNLKLWRRGFQVSKEKVQAVENGPYDYNIYAGEDILWQSYDGGLSVHPISTYNGHPTHGDCRGLMIQKATNSLRGKDDIVFFATDGGVAIKPAGNDVGIDGNHTCQDISTSGLVCSNLWGVSTSEAGGLVICGAQHNGMYAYEPKQLAVKWKQYGLPDIGDGMSVVFEQDQKNKAWATDQHNGIYIKTTSGSGREIDGFDATNNSFPFEGTTSRFPLWTDNNNNQYTGQRRLYVKPNGQTQWNSMSDIPVLVPSDPYYTQLPYLAKSGILAMVFNPYSTSVKPEGYVTLFPVGSIDDPSGKTKQIYYHAPGTDVFAAKSLPKEGPVMAIAMDPRNTNRVWIGYGGVSGIGTAGMQRVYYSSDGGDNWIDVSSGLPDRVPVTALVYHEGINNIYCATDVGMFKMDFTEFNPENNSNNVNSSVYWSCFNTPKAKDDPEFPNMVVTQLAINYCEGKLFASTYGRGLWSTDLLVEPNGSSDPTIGDVVPDQTEIISVNTDWDQDKYITSGIRVKAGAILTIKNNAGTQTTIHMPKNGAIVVEQGGTIVVDGAKITHDCSGFWKGILVLGYPYQPQIINSSAQTSNQGYAILKNGAVIENARAGLVNAGESLPIDWAGSAGGVIQADNVVFHNNARSGVFYPYHNKPNNVSITNNESYFKKCQFLVDNQFRGEGFDYNYSAGITMSDVEGINIISCNFENQATDNAPDTKGIGNGVISWNSGYNIIPSCPSGSGCDPSLYIPNTFSGFKEGVNSGGDNQNVNNYVFIDYAKFDKNGIGIMVQNTNLFNVFRSDFSLNNGGTVYGNCNCQRGIYAENTPMFRIEQNVFTGNKTGQSQSYGVYLTNTGANANDVYKNNFKGLDFACYALGTNRGYTSIFVQYPYPTVWLQNAGVTFTCNSYIDNLADIGINPQTASNPSYTGIKDEQGSPQMSAGNIFSPAVGSTLLNPYIVANYADPLKYYYKNANEAIFSTSNQTPIAIDYGNDCPIKDITTPNGTPYYRKQKNKDDVITARADWEQAVATHIAKVDGGNTDGLISVVNTSENEIGLRNKLMALAPFVSERVIKAVISSGKLPQSMQLEILKANPDVLTPAFITYLQSGVSFPYSEDAITELSSYQYTITDYTKEVTDISSKYSFIMHHANNLMIDLKSDSSGTSLDTFSKYYSLLPSLSSRYQVALMHLGNKNYNAASTVMANIPDEFSLSEDDAKEYEAYQNIFTILKDTVGNGNTIVGLDANGLAQMKAIADLNAGSASATALAIYNQGAKIDYFPCIIGTGGAHRGSINNYKAPGKGIQSDNKVQAFPNPAKDYVNFQYRLPTAKDNIELTIHNSYGQLVLSRKLDKKEGLIWIDTRGIPTGNYIYNFMDGNLNINSGKLTITR